MEKKKVAVVGAGPGGLTAGMLLAHRGYDVTVYEKEGQVGGRNAQIRLGDYRFDVGPTFLMMKFILEEVFEATGRKLEDYLELMRLDPMYQLKFADYQIYPTQDHDMMRQQIQKHFPGNEGGFDRFLKKEKVRYESMFPCLQKDYCSLSAYFRPVLIKALPYLLLEKKLFDFLGTYFDKDDLRIAFTFQSKYLGMSAWECPAAFIMLSYVEHAYGIYHVKGGLSEISKAMAEVIGEEGGKLELGTEVERILVEGGEAKGVKLRDGKEISYDIVVLNADFAYAMDQLVDKGDARKYSREKIRNMKYSCSTYMLYLGLDKLYDIPHHNIVFSDDYRRNVDEIFTNKTLSEDISFYVRNASKTDETLAPEGHSAVYVLVPVPNKKSSIEWEKTKVGYREKVLDAMEKKLDMQNIRSHIKEEKVITPDDWEKDYNVFLGATFNLSHNLMQMLYLRPHNRFEEFRNCYLVGGGTHPGSGLPTIYESARISAALIEEDDR